MTDLPIGLTEDERAKLAEALHELPALLAEAHAMRTTLHVNHAGTGPTQAASRPPTDLTLIAATQNINHAWNAVATAALDAYHTLETSTPHNCITALANPTNIHWYATCWWARNQVLIPLRQARTALRRLTRQQAATRLLCPNCGGTLQPMDGATWHRCTMCETVIDHRTEIAKVAPLTEHATNPALPAQATLYRLAKRGAITPIGHDHRGDLYHLTHILDAISNTA